MINAENDLIQRLEQNPNPWAQVAFTDFDGVIRGKVIRKNKLIKILHKKEQLKICNIIFGWDLTDTDYEDIPIATADSGNPDLFLVPDLSTLSFIPWDKQMPFIICDLFESDGTPHPLCPRMQLKKLEQKINQDGYFFKSAFELEFNLFNLEKLKQSPVQFEPISRKHHGFSLHSFYESKNFYSDCLEYLPSFNVDIYAFHQESGPGMWEVSLSPKGLIDSADQCIRLKYALKSLGPMHQIYVSFMSKWNEIYAGLGGHIHMSLWKDEENLFFSSIKTRKQFIAGLQSLLPELMPMLAPNINSYKRFVEEEFCPTQFNYGLDRRDKAFRIIVSRKEDSRIENRIPGADVNPYWGLYASTLSGLFGIDHSLTLNDQLENQHLPKNLNEATLLMQNSNIIRELLPTKLFNHWIQSRIWEWNQMFQEFAPSLNLL